MIPPSVAAHRSGCRRRSGGEASHLLPGFGTINSFWMPSPDTRMGTRGGDGRADRAGGLRRCEGVGLRRQHRRHVLRRNTSP